MIFFLIFYDFDLWIGTKFFWFYENLWKIMIFYGYFYDFLMILLGSRGRKKNIKTIIKFS